MKHELKPYMAYKQTDNDWLGAVPEHWQLETIRSITRLYNEKNGIRNDLEILSVYREYGVIKKSSRDDNRNKSNDLTIYKVVNKGDLVLNKMKMWQGSLGVSQYKGIVSSQYTVCKLVGDFNSNYIHYMLRSAKFKNIYNKISYGVRSGQWVLRYDDFKNIKLYIPPLSEQDQIVKFLDSMLVKINRFIRFKKKLISALKEQKLAIINEAVTKGIDSNVKMKPSGIEWLGDIPDHWEVKPNFALFIERNEKNYCDMELLSVTISDGIIKQSQMLENNTVKRDSSNDDKSNYKRVLENDIVYNKMRMWQGAAGCSLHDGIVSPAYIILKPKVDMCPWYFHFLFRTPLYSKYAYTYSYGICDDQLSLRYEHFKRMYSLVPPLEEQERIVEFIKSKTEQVEASIVKVQKEIELITEYRTRLISDVVTGEVDVGGIEIQDNMEQDTGSVDEIDEDELDNEEVLNLEECEV